MRAMRLYFAEEAVKRRRVPVKYIRNNEFCSGTGRGGGGGTLNISMEHSLCP